MARVVQRSTPPYLLIVFIFLFFIAFALAVLFYMQQGDAKKEADEARELASKFASEAEQAQESVRAMLAKAQPSVVEQLQQRVGQLANRIAGTFDYDKAMQMADRVAPITGPSSMVGALENLNTSVKQQETTVGDLRREITSATKKQQQLGEAIEKLQADLKAKDQDFTQKLAAAQSQVDSDRQKHEGLLKQAREEWDRIREDLEREDARKANQVQVLEQDIQRHLLTIRELKDKLAANRPKLDPSVIVRQPDGKIERVLPEHNVVFINLGTADGVEPGLTFTVYPQSGMPKDPEAPGKATIEIRNVSATFSECTIIKQDPKEPIVAGDLIANVTFDKNRTYVFMVEGLFDLHGAAKPTREGAKEVEDVIRRAGGKLRDSMDYDVDFLVLGEEPPRPPTPNAENATVVEAYEAQLKQWERYQKIKAEAPNYPVYVLNTNRFLALTGYLPKKPASPK